jgi:hypothetical protein
MAIKIFDSKSAPYLILTVFLFVAGCGCNEKGSGTNEADAQVDAGVRQTSPQSFWGLRGE